MRYLLFSTLLAFFVSTAFAQEGCPENMDAVVACCAGKGNALCAVFSQGQGQGQGSWCRNPEFAHSSHFMKDPGANLTASRCDPNRTAEFCYLDTEGDNKGNCKKDPMRNCNLAGPQYCPQY